MATITELSLAYGKYIQTAPSLETIWYFKTKSCTILYYGRLLPIWNPR